MQRQNSTNWNIADPITAERLNDFNLDLDLLFKEISSENLSFTYNLAWRCTQIVDNENSITLNIDWSEFDVVSPNTPKLFLQKVGDTKKRTITYNQATWLPVSMVYA